MRVLVQIRTNRGDRDGGDTLHAECKATELRALGVEVDVTGDWAADPSSYDLVHLYNTALIEPTLRRAFRARGCGVPIVIETIYWDTSYSQPPLTFRNEQAMRRVALALAERAIPSSTIEAQQIEAAFPETAGKLRAIPLGVDGRPDLAGGDGAGFCERHGLEPGFVLCVGRKELRKNQLRLIRACGGLGVGLVLAGGEHPEAASYLAECREAAESAGAGVMFLPHLEGVELAGAYAAAGVHAQPSIKETVGISSLEAALAGCNVVTTSESGISEYLGDDAWYCDPWSEESIGEAVTAALAAAEPAGVAERLREQFSWRRAAEETLVVYEEAMREHEQRNGEPILPPSQYAEHLEELVQLQLEAIAFRDESIQGFHSHTVHLEREAAHARADAEHARADAEHARADAEHARADAEHARAEAEQARAEVEGQRAESERTIAELAVTRAALDEERAELERLHATRLFRWSAPLRGLYGWLRSS